MNAQAKKQNFMEYGVFGILCGLLSSVNERRRVFAHTEVSTDKCGDHVHLTLEQECRVLEALGVTDFNEDSWKGFVKGELAIKGEYGMRCSVYARYPDGSFHRFGWVRSEQPRGFSQAETTPSGHRSLTGMAHDHERMSGDLEGTEVVDIVAVQLDRLEKVSLSEPFAIQVMVAALHAHVPPGYEGNEVRVSYGRLTKVMPAKVSRCTKTLVHPHGEEYVRLMTAVESAEQEKREQEDLASDEPFRMALGPLW